MHLHKNKTISFFFTSVIFWYFEVWFLTCVKFLRMPLMENLRVINVIVFTFLQNEISKQRFWENLSLCKKNLSWPNQQKLGLIEKTVQLKVEMKEVGLGEEGWGRSNSRVTWTKIEATCDKHIFFREWQKWCRGEGLGIYL